MSYKCKQCGSEVTGEDLAELQVRKRVECKFCRNLIVLDEGKNKVQTNLRCMVCGGPLRMDDLPLTATEGVCSFCKKSIDQYAYEEADYPGIFERLKAIPREKVEEIYKMLMREENFKQLNKGQQQELKDFGTNFKEKMEEIYQAKKWTVAKSAIKYIGKSIGAMLGMATLGGAVGMAVGYLISYVGCKYIDKKA